MFQTGEEAKKKVHEKLNHRKAGKQFNKKTYVKMYNSEFPSQ